jgi:hypothetical protein
MGAARHAVEMARECRLAGYGRDAGIWLAYAANVRRSVPWRIA